MMTFQDRIAVVTGGGSGMGRELARQLAMRGAHVAICDVSEEAMRETQATCAKDSPTRRVSIHVANVARQADVEAFRDGVMAAHGTECVHLLFNNAGIGGGFSFVTSDRAQWERTFDICWGGVYLTTRAFFPLLLKADAGHISNTSSIMGFWATNGENVPASAYAAAKFAVRGFTESLITDLRVNAPHITASVIMPGRTATSILVNTQKIQSGDASGKLGPADLALWRTRLGMAADSTDAEVQAAWNLWSKRPPMAAPTSAAEAARIILDAVAEGSWRIFIGEDARYVDEQVRLTPESAYEPAFVANLRDKLGWPLN